MCKLAKIASQQDSVSFNKYFEQICKDKIRYLRFSVYNTTLKTKHIYYTSLNKADLYNFRPEPVTYCRPEPFV